MSANDYYPFGMAMPGRTHSSPSYRYGFNGKEKDESGEWGDLTHYDYGFRIYNAGIAKFLSVDPLTSNYGMLTPYQYASNTPIQAIDIDGLESFRDLGNSLDPVMQRMNATEIDEAWFNLGFGIGLGIGAYVGLEIFVTKGKLTQTLGGLLAVSTLSQLHYIDKLSRDEQSRVRQEIKNELSYEFLGYGVGKAIEQVAGLAIVLSKNGDELYALEDLPEAVVSANRSTKQMDEIPDDFWYPSDVSVFHKGKLSGGKVSSNRSLSTGKDFESVNALDRAGEVHQFNIPRKVYDDWIDNAKAVELKDLDSKTGIYNTEVRFKKEISAELNKYKVNEGS